MEDEPVELEELDAPEYYETEKILRWRWAKTSGRRGRRYKEFLTMWHGYPLEETSWVLEKDFSDQRQLQLASRMTTLRKRSNDISRTTLSWGGVIVVILDHA